MYQTRNRIRLRRYHIRHRFRCRHQYYRQSRQRHLPLGRECLHYLRVLRAGKTPLAGLRINSRQSHRRLRRLFRYYQRRY